MKQTVKTILMMLVKPIKKCLSDLHDYYNLFVFLFFLALSLFLRFSFVLIEFVYSLHSFISKSSCFHFAPYVHLCML